MVTLSTLEYDGLRAELRAARAALADLVALVDGNPRQYQYDAELGAIVDEARALVAE